MSPRFPWAGPFTKPMPQPTQGCLCSTCSVWLWALHILWTVQTLHGLIFFISFPVVLFLPWSLKACWDQTKQTFFDSFRLFALVYLVGNEKSKGILCLCYRWSSDVQSLKSGLLDNFESLNWDVKEFKLTLQYFLWLQHGSCCLNYLCDQYFQNTTPGSTDWVSARHHNLLPVQQLAELEWDFSGPSKVLRCVWSVTSSFLLQETRLENWSRFLLCYAVLILHRNASHPEQWVKQRISVKGILGSYKDCIWFKKKGKWMACILLATSQPEHTSDTTYLDFKSEEQLLEIMCIFNFNIIFLKNPFRSSVSAQFENIW